MICPNCGIENDDDKIYCASCMTKLKNKCIKCGNVYDLGINNCPNCQSKAYKDINVNSNNNSIIDYLFSIFSLIIPIILMFECLNFKYSIMYKNDIYSVSITYGLSDTKSFMIGLFLLLILIIGLCGIYTLFLVKNKLSIIGKRIFNGGIILLAVIFTIILQKYFIMLKNGSVEKYFNYDNPYVYNISGLLTVSLVFSYVLIGLLVVIVVIREILNRRCN